MRQWPRTVSLLVALMAAPSLYATAQTATLDLSTIIGSINPNCTAFKIIGVCLCGIDEPCVVVEYWEPAYMVTTVKITGKPLLAGSVLEAFEVGSSGLFSALAAQFGLAGLGGGGSANTAESGQTNLHFNEARVYRLPSLQGFACGTCNTNSKPFTLHYMSDIDPAWRQPTAVAALPDIPFLNPLGVWASLFPRIGFVIHGSEPVAAVAAATRAYHVAAHPLTPPPVQEARIVVDPGANFFPCFQMGWPTMKPCFRTGTHPSLWENGAPTPTGEYLWFFWQRKSCCVRLEQATCAAAVGGISGVAQFCPLPLDAAGLIGAGTLVPTPDGDDDDDPDEDSSLPEPPPPEEPLPPPVEPPPSPPPLICENENGGRKQPVVHAASCAPTDVQAAINRANAGDLVQLPACNFTGWNRTVNINKAITLAGAGAGQTRIRHSSGGTMLSVSGVVGFELRGMTIEGRVAGREQDSDTGLLLRNSRDFKIHDNVFTHLGVGIMARGNGGTQRGVIYQNTFRNIADYQPCCLGYGVRVNGDGAWPRLELGTINSVFIEDNFFEGVRHGVESENGSRYTARYNTFVNMRENSSAIDAHGSKTNAWPRGSRQFEIYGNRIHSPGGWAGIGLRGGDGVVFGNDIRGVKHEILLWNEDSGSGRGGHCAYPCQDQIRNVAIWDQDPGSVTVPQAHQHLIRNNRDYTVGHAPSGYRPYPYPHPLRKCPPVS